MISARISRKRINNILPQVMNNENLPTITIVPSQVKDGLYRLDINVSGVPSNMFGVAFHLKISGDGWRLMKYEGGDVFAADGATAATAVTGATAATSGKLFAIASEKTVNGEREILAGVVRTSPQNGAAKDGTLISFYVKGFGTELLNMKFTDTHMSVYEGGRRDLTGVVWRDKTISPARSVGSEQDLMQQPNRQSTQLQTNVIATNGGADPNSSPNDSLIQIYWFLFSVLAVMLVVYVVYCFYARWRRINIKKPK